MRRRRQLLDLIPRFGDARLTAGPLTRVIGLALLIAASASCGSGVTTGRSPVYLVINSLQAASGNHPTTLGGNLLSSVVTNVTSPPPCSTATPCQIVFNDVGQVILAVSMKDVLVTPTTNNAVTITRYHIDFVRADGRNTPGVDVPFGFDGGVTGTIQPGGTLTAGFEIVRHDAKLEPPLVGLVTNPGSIINTIANITFYGTDQVGNPISVTGSILVDFGNFANS
ncbi:MAG TPA: hypothetical protein VNZ26_19495 [Vicinamibacterales bacterium]|jgi:hypothetical protein|nr:hypothetical protein [Vicinamibacterales bacterium]